MSSWSCVRYAGARAAAAILLAALASGGTAEAQSGLGLQLVASGLASPVALANAGDGSMRLFIVEQAGIIRIHNGSQVLPTPFLDISARVLSGGERGLLGLAFHPSYASNGFFYVFYTSQPAGEVTIARYSVTGDPNVASPQSELILKTQAHAAFGNHNGGSLVFGPDGCLYAGIGDGGSGGDPDGNGQNLGTLLAKIIRISPSDGAPCPAAPGNPFVGMPGARGEIWALGLRNPWRITFDRQTGDLLIGDVGQGTREEVDFQPPGIAGRNYCWRRLEGTFVFDATTSCTAGTPTNPILEYDHSAGRCSITGGYRYRGSRLPTRVGTYFYADFCTGEIWGATQSGSLWTTSVLFDTTLSISSFGEDEAGEIYVAHLGGTIHRLVLAQVLQVSPATGIAASGAQGGPFSPSSFAYSLSTTSGTVNYSISLQFDPGVPAWLTASSTSGTATTTPTGVTFTINPAANGLNPGTYNATVTFTNTTSGQAAGTRMATLTVSSQTMQVSPAAGVAVSGTQGGPFSPPSFAYSLGATSGSVNYSISVQFDSGVPSWLTATPSSGTATTSPTNVTFTISPAANGLGPGTYNAAIAFANTTNGRGNSSRMVTLTINPPMVSPPIVDSPACAMASQLGDFGGDARSDLLFRRTDGQLELYQMNGAQVLSTNLLGIVGVEWRIAGVADFNGDGRADILFRRETDGMLELFLMNGAEVLAAQLLGVVGTEWEVVGIADVNGDGRADILFRRGDGMLELYLMNGFQVLAVQLLGNIGTEWRVHGLRDFDGDGRADILFRRESDGMLELFLMNGFQVLAAQLLGVVGTEFTLVGVGDLNGDARSDMLFRRSDGTLSLYLMDGFQVLSAQSLGNVGSEWNACYGQPPLRR